MALLAPPDLEAHLRKKLREEWGVPSQRTLWAAYSGGADSTALLHALHRIGQPVHAVHVDHGWHAGSALWAEECRRGAAALGIPCTVLRLEGTPDGEGPEDAARRGRYALLSSRLRPGDLLLVAQHRDDQAETLLLQLLRGSGLEGLAAMPSRRPLGAGILARPFLDLGREDLRAYLRRLGISWREDPANQENRYARTRIRRDLLPRMEALGWARASLVLARTAENLGDALQTEAWWFADRLAALRQRFPGFEAGLLPPGLPVAFLLEMEPAALRVFLRHWIRYQGIAVPDRAGLERLRLQLGDGRGGRRIEWKGGQAWIQGGRLWLWLPAPVFPDFSGGDWIRSGDRGDGPFFAWEVDRGSPPGPAPAAGAHRLSLQVLPAQLHWRSRRPGERYMDGNGRHRPVKKLLLEAGVPPFLRDSLPLLWDPEGRLVLIPGFYTAPWAKGLSGEPGLWVWFHSSG